MVERPGLKFRVHACPRCGGDAYLEKAGDDSDWRCLQCGRVVPDALSAREPARLQPAPLRIRLR